MKRKLGKMETAQALTNQVFTFNAVIVLRTVGGPCEETLAKLLEYLPHRHPLLGVHLWQEKGSYFFVSEGTPKIPLTVIERQNSGHWRQVTEDELNRKFDLYKGPLVRFTYLAGSGGSRAEKESEIIVTFQHSVLDAVSSGTLLHEILSLCQEIESGGSVEKIKIVEPLPPLPPVEAFFPPSFRGIRGKWKMFLFAFRQMGDEFRFRLRAKGKRKAPLHPAGKCKILPMKLPEETGAALLKCTRKKRITLNNLLTAAMLMAVHKHLYNGRALPLRQIHTADLRPYLNPPLEPQYMGSYFAMMRFTLGMKENPAVWDLAREIGDITYSALKRGDKFCANLSSLTLMRMLFRLKSFRMAAAALSYTGPVTVEKKYGKIEVRDLHAFVSNFVLGPEYTALVGLFDNRIYWNILYMDSDMDHERAGVIAAEIRAILESALEEES